MERRNFLHILGGSFLGLSFLGFLFRGSRGAPTDPVGTISQAGCSGMMGQKFLTGYEVKIDDKLHPSMDHFPAGCNAIVMYTYSQAFGGRDIKSYSLVLLDEDHRPYNEVSWYDESQLTLVSKDIEAGMKIAEDYRFG